MIDNYSTGSYISTSVILDYPSVVAASSLYVPAPSWNLPAAPKSVGFRMSTYITGWAMPKGAIAGPWLKDWQAQHDKDHMNIYNALNSINVSLGNAAYRVDKIGLTFDEGDIKSINDFLRANKFQHAEFYKWMNQIGAALSNFNRAPISVRPMMNPAGPFLRFDENAWGDFSQSERAVHLMQLSAINQLYSAFN